MRGRGRGFRFSKPIQNIGSARGPDAPSRPELGVRSQNDATLTEPNADAKNHILESRFEGS